VALRHVGPPTRWHTAAILSAMGEDVGYRTQLWRYYDLRPRDPTGTARARALEYWRGLGVAVTGSEIEEEDTQVRAVLASLPPATYLEVGSGPGGYTAVLRGQGIALDQSATALHILRSRHVGVPVLRADGLELPLRDSSVERLFASHVYGILQPSERVVLLVEARRVARQVVLLDSGRPPGVPAEQWQQRSVRSDGQVFRVLRRHFRAAELAAEIGGRVLFAGRFYVVVVA
jgi:hypothetical protein